MNVGTKVKIIRSFSDSKPGWNSEMDLTINQVGFITYVNFFNALYQVHFPQLYLSMDFWYPAEVLLVMPKSYIIPKALVTQTETCIMPETNTVPNQVINAKIYIKTHKVIHSRGAE